MNDRLSAFVAELYTDGVTHDAAQPDRILKRRNLEPATAELLSLIVRIAGARHVVEVGTANGYSTIWLADAVGDTGGHVGGIDTPTSHDPPPHPNPAHPGHPRPPQPGRLPPGGGGAPPAPPPP